MRKQTGGQTLGLKYIWMDKNNEQLIISVLHGINKIILK